MADTDGVPNFTFSEEDIAAIKASLGAVDVDESQERAPQEDRPKRRGRPPGSKNKSYDSPPVEQPKQGFELKLEPQPLTKREEKEVAGRLQDIFTGATGMAGVIKPYLEMTDEEAEAIATPLASYLVRNESTNAIAREILENYDLLAMTLGVGAYGVRVYKDRKQEIESKRPANTTAMERISEHQSRDNGQRPNEGENPQISVPNATRSGSSPFDI